MAQLEAKNVRHRVSEESLSDGIETAASTSQTPVRARENVQSGGYGRYMTAPRLVEGCRGCHVSSSTSYSNSGLASPPYKKFRPSPLITKEVEDEPPAITYAQFTRRYSSPPV